MPDLARHADAARIRELEQDLGLYQPTGDNIDECPRCGGVSVLTHEREKHENAYVCAACATEILGVADPDYRSMMWECCQTRDLKPPFCMSGCTHMLKRRDATLTWRHQQRAVATSAHTDGSDNGR